MFTIIIQEKGGEQRRMVFNKPEVTIGRVQGNDIVLPKGNVSKRHARIVLKDGKFIIVDLKSTNGTYVNGRKITSPLVVKDSDKIYIGDFIVGVDEAAAEGDGPSETTTSPPGVDRLANASANDVRPPRPTEAQPMPVMPSGMGGMNRGDMGRDMGMGGMGGMGGGGMAPMPPEPAPPPPVAPPRPVPPRPPGPSMPSREPPPDRSERAGLERAMPPIAPPPGEPRPNRPAAIGRPGGTMPPPMAPIPAPMPPPSLGSPQPLGAPPPLDDHRPAPLAGPQPDGLGGISGMGGNRPGPMGGPMPMNPGPMPMNPGPMPMAAPMPRPEPFERPAPVAPMMAAPGPSAMPMERPAPRPAPAQQQMENAAPVGQPAQVVPLNSPGTGNKRALVGAGAKKVIGRSVSMPSRRGVQIEPLDPKVVKMLDLQSNILERLRTKLDIDKIPIERLHEEELWQRAERATIDLVETLETSGELPKYIDQDTLIKETLSEALALGPLEDLLADEKIDEIIIDRRDRVVVGKEGQLRGSGKAFSSDEMFERVVKRLVAEAGATIDEANPLVDLRMRDGTRLTAAVSPVASRGACLVLKKSPTTMPQLAELASQGALSPGMADFLATCVTARRNILVCGGPASGKTTLVAALAAASPMGERVISIEEVAELAIARDEWIQLETRPGSGRHASIDLGHLLETALRLVPDRLVVGDVKGRETLPLVSALCSSIDGAIVAMTGEGAPASLGRLVTLARVGASAASDGALRELVAQAFEIVVHVARWSDGSIRVMAIEEVVGCTDATFDSQVLFQFRDGSFVATGTVPRFYAELEARGIPADQAVFR